ncbi:hypothetical protein TEA_004173 [Camellia sinensis var. sinensis]|uniref:Uncharacterized protein n=1 Tax=Camellia sinensis var. sinensis TaxID=542762 RepID=A0A4S4E4X5_CAMSN|nr:hypothetical protein TEA_004173 [Camellia sinensis var. sinensis]
MESEEPKDQLKGMDWNSIGDSIHNEPSAGPVTKKRLPRKVRQIPDCYFLPRRSLPTAIAFYGAWIVAGVGAGMLAEIWINKKVKGMPFISLKMCLDFGFGKGFVEGKVMWREALMN